MCGITGFLRGPTGSREVDAARALNAMTDALARRGPDASGVWRDPTERAWLGHRRLSVIDLSPTGAQPMSSHDGRYHITFNGEIYNYQELRAELEKEGVDGFRGSSDTEVLLEGFSRWGIEPMLKRVIGMFAFALWDSRDEVLTLARDRLGEKPIYYGWMGGDLLFGSDTSALAAHPGFVGRIDRTSLGLYLRFGYVPSPRSIFEGVQKLPPAGILQVRAKDGRETLSQYWDAVAVAREAAERRVDPAGSIDALEMLLRRTVRRSTVSDVPIGVFLSGGIDSSTVAALMRSESTGPVHTFTIGFSEERYNEAEHAKRVAEHLGTVHTELYVSAEEARGVIPLLPAIYAEPFADSSQIPTYLVSRLARKHVTVALSGDGGDEIFGGYTRHVLAARLLRRLERVPRILRRSAAAALRCVPPWGYDALVRAAGPLAPRQVRAQVRAGTLGEKAHKLARILEARDVRDHYLRVVSIWQEPERLLRKAGPPTSDERTRGVGEGVRDPAERMMLLDTLTYLPDDIMVKVDRAAMHVSLETRAPLLSHEVFEAAWRLPPDQRIRGGQGKWALRQVLYRYVPRELVERPKTGFGVPMSEWLRGPLRAWAEELLSEARLSREGLLEPAPIREAWKEHLSGVRDRHHELWVILMFQAWLDAHRSMLER